MAEPYSEPLAGKYRLIRQLGQGGMGAVWQAEHVTLHAMVAVKLLDPTMALTKDGLNRFLREAQAAASLRSPHIVQILDHGIDRGIPYIAMELLEGESLGARLDRVGGLSPTQTAQIIAHIARAITRAHDAGIVHRDLKPDNVFLVPNDDEEVVKVLDFGIAKSTTHLATNTSDSTRTGTMLGTPYYMSPEQVESATNADFRTDIWALGVIAYQCILGKRPFEGETIGSLFLAICSKEFPVPSRRGQVPLGFDAWFARCCARDPNQRFATAREAAAELRRVAAAGESAAVSFQPDSGQTAQSFGNTTGQNAAVGYSTPPKRGPRLLLLPILAAGIVLGGALGWKALSSDDEPALGTRAAADNPRQPVTTPPAASVSAAVAAPPVPSASASASASASTSVSTSTSADTTRTPAVGGAAPTAAPRPPTRPPKQPPSSIPAGVDLGL